MTNPQFIKVDAPPVMKDRTTGGKVRVPAGRPTHIARRITSVSGNAAAGRKNASVIRNSYKEHLEGRILGSCCRGGDTGMFSHLRP